MNSIVKVALAQVDLAVGDVAGNTAKILDYAARARDEMHADLVIFLSSVFADTRPKTFCCMRVCDIAPNRLLPKFARR